VPPAPDDHRDLPNTTRSDGASVLTIGVFDGVHLGHRRLVETARDIADGLSEDARVVVLAFDPPPRAVLDPDGAPPRLTGFEHRADLLLDCGADEVLRLEPSAALLGLSPERFVDEVLMPLHPAAVVEGPDFRFGVKRAGDVRTLSKLGETRGFSVRVVEPVEVLLNDQSVVAASSSRARWLLERGRVADAGRVLGRAYEMVGEVVRGDQRGRTIGFPTANLQSEQMPPGDGVYACVATLENGQTIPCAVNVGERPTFDGVEHRVEAHLIGYDRDGDEPEYGWPLRIAFVSRLRDQVRFGGVEQLTAQLSRDVARANEILSTTVPSWTEMEKYA
jgi:riboflavin kinase/FMN adenylyltransferase